MINPKLSGRPRNLTQEAGTAPAALCRDLGGQAGPAWQTLP